MNAPSLSRLLREDDFPKLKGEGEADRRLDALQKRMLRIQQGVFHAKKRAIIAMEGADATGKGGAIRRLTEALDPRGIRVVPIGAPTPDEQGRHYLYRFWRDLPVPGVITIFDRTWYGRVLVERVEELCPPEAWKRAYREICEFERMLVDDGVDMVKIYLGVSRDEQYKRFEERLKNPDKQWKIGEADVEARLKWDDYVEAADEMFKRTHTKEAPWHLVAADHKWYARVTVLEIVTRALGHHADWFEGRMQKKMQKKETAELRRQLARLK